MTIFPEIPSTFHRTFLYQTPKIAHNGTQASHCVSANLPLEGRSSIHSEKPLLMSLKNKNCAPFAYDWIKQSLPGLKVDDGQQSAEISSVTSVSGDCDLGQRKGKWVEI